MFNSRRTFRNLVGLGIVFLLAGCQTSAQQQFQTMQAGNVALVAQAKSCLAETYNTPEAAPLRPHFPLDPRDVTLVQLSDQSFATPQEIDAILVLHPRLQACRKAVVDGLLNTTPSVIPVLTKEYAGSDDDTIALVQRKMSWGERVRRGRDRAIAAQAELQIEGQRIIAGLERSHEAEVARRQSALNALAQWAQTQQVIAAMNRPVITNCTQLGNFTNCTTR